MHTSSKNVLRYQSNHENLIGEIFRKSGTQYLVSIYRDPSPEALVYIETTFETFYSGLQNNSITTNNASSIYMIKDTNRYVSE